MWYMSEECFVEFPDELAVNCNAKLMPFCLHAPRVRQYGEDNETRSSETHPPCRPADNNHEEKTEQKNKPRLDQALDRNSNRMRGNLPPPEQHMPGYTPVRKCTNEILKQIGSNHVHPLSLDIHHSVID